MASLVVALVVFVWRNSENPVYQSSVLVSVTSGRAIAGETVTAQDTLFLGRNYAKLALTEPVLSEAVERSGLKVSLAEARRRARARAATDVGYITVSALGPTPQAASSLTQATADALLAVVLRQQDATLGATLRPVEEEIAELEGRLATLRSPAGQRTLEARYDALVRSATERRLAPTDRLTVVAAARRDPLPVSPRPIRDATVALVVALIVNAELAVAIDALRDRFSVEEPEESVLESTDLPVLARIPATGDDQVVEAFRTLRTNLLFMKTRNAVRTIAVVSAEPGAGKSFTSLHLAAAMAFMDVPVVIVDGDLRRPSLHDALGTPAAPGVADAVEGSEAQQFVHPIPENRYLHLVPGGTPSRDPAAVLGSSQFGTFLSRLHWACVVIVDTPACTVFADGLAIASQCDATVVVVDPRKSKRRAVKRTLAQLRQVGANPVGIVLNRLERPGRSSYYYAYRQENESSSGKPLSPASSLDS